MQLGSQRVGFLSSLPLLPFYRVLRYAEEDGGEKHRVSHISPEFAGHLSSPRHSVIHDYGGFGWFLDRPGALSGDHHVLMTDLTLALGAPREPCPRNASEAVLGQHRLDFQSQFPIAVQESVRRPCRRDSLRDELRSSPEY
jgi:hypothetical protein